ncbi:hypothetical protein BD414DRAFT_494692 [Trametes punicea]|nr:hypothetical protein BD414DRAFT_494692 [Trametes punicea]
MDRASSSDSSSESPPRILSPEDDGLAESSESNAAIYNSMLKRHYSGQAASSFGASEGAREPKARRKESRVGGGGGAGPASVWEQGSLPAGRGQRDELLDQALVDQLRSRESSCSVRVCVCAREMSERLCTGNVEFGDPFDDTILKKAAGTTN